MRHWSIVEANDALPEVERLLSRGRDVIEELAKARGQLEDLRIVYGDNAASEPGVADEFESWQEAHRRGRERLDEVNLQFEALGVEVKDIQHGLVDFRSIIGDQEVYLCWQRGEPRVEHWHTIAGGFSRRQKIPDFTMVEQ